MCNWDLMKVIANWGELEGEENILINGGDFWLLRYLGGAPQLLPDQTGLKYVQFYLKNPGQQYLVEEMAIHAEGIALADTDKDISDYSDQELNSGYTDELIDEQTLLVCKKRLRQINEIMQEEKLSEEEWESFRKEAKKIKDYLSQTSRKSKPRLEVGNSKKERDRATSALRRAVAVIEAKIPLLGAHLKERLNISIKGGYFPRQPTHWKV